MELAAVGRQWSGPGDYGYQSSDTCVANIWLEHPGGHLCLVVWWHLILFSSAPAPLSHLHQCWQVRRHQVTSSASLVQVQCWYMFSIWRLVTGGRWLEAGDDSKQDMLISDAVCLKLSRWEWRIFQSVKCLQFWFFFYIVVCYWLQGWWQNDKKLSVILKWLYPCLFRLITWTDLIGLINQSGRTWWLFSQKFIF